MPDVEKLPTERVTLRAVLIGVGLILLSALWVRQVELIWFTCQITESIPPIPALAVVIVFAALAPILKRLGKWFSLAQSEIICIYVMVMIGSVMSSV